MVNSNNVKKLLAGVTLALMLMAALPAFAQEATQAATTSAASEVPKGGGLLFLLIGLGAILLITVIWLVRERTENAPETVS